MPARVLDASALSEEAFAQIYEVMVSCHAESNAEEPYRSVAETAAFLRYPPASEPRCYWIAERGADCCGFAQLGVVVGTPNGRVEILVRWTPAGGETDVSCSKPFASRQGGWAVGR